jgi:glycosyltransferase involved in cell wall biosynthesis
MNLVEAMPQIIDEKKDVQLLIIGKGKLDNKIHKFIEDNSLKNNIKMIGWVDNYKLPDYLNNLKLLILPSYSEGLPGVIVESMACGTPVLTTNVGSIPDIIENHKNGFILDDNNSKCISKSVLGILKSDEINKISENAQKTANKKFSYNNALNLWKKVYCENDG